MEQQFKIKGMMCNHCKANVERTLATLMGVESVTVDLTAGVAHVVGTIEAEKVIAAIEAMGYEHVAQ